MPAAQRGYFLERPGKICFCQFTTDETITISTQRELLTIEYIQLSSFSRVLKHEAVIIQTYNLSASNILELGSIKACLHSIALEIFKICVENYIKIIPTWIPRERNCIADYYSDNFRHR